VTTPHCDSEDMTFSFACLAAHAKHLLQFNVTCAQACGFKPRSCSDAMWRS
jgi:hypothetical protein